MSDCKKTIVAPLSFNNGIPAIGLPSASIRIRDANSGELIVSDEPMVEVGDGFYRYDFNQYTSSINYTIRVDGGVELGSNRFSFAVNEHYSYEVWEEPISCHTGSVFLSGSTTPLSSSGQVLSFIRDIEAGRWKIDTTANTMTFYGSDGVTPIAVYDLFDADGNPNHCDTFERVPK